MTEETIVDEGGITVTKAFDRSGFPVPAVTFRVESDRSDPVTVRIVDEIPPDFGIEQIGFHPEYGSEHWTATGNGTVRFERSVDAGESFTTVYGVKMTAEERADPFLGEPTLEVNPEEIDDSAIEDVVPRESSDVVRELAEGERDTIPGLEAESETPTTADTNGVESEAAEEVTETEPAETQPAAVADDDAEILGETGSEPETESESTPSEESETGVSEEDAGPTTEEILEAGSDTFGTDTSEESEPTAMEEGSDAATAEPSASESETEDAGAEVPSESTEDEPAVSSARSDELAAVEEMEQEPTTEATESETAMNDEPTETTEPASRTAADDSDTENTTTDAAAGSLAASLASEIRDGTVDDEDLAVIREAVGEPSASDAVRLEHLQARVSDLEAYTDALEEFIEENGGARTVLSDLESTVESVADDVQDIGSRVDSAQGEREALRERINSLADDLGTFEEISDTVERVSGDLSALEERVADGEQARIEVSSLEDVLADVQDDVEELADEIEDIEDDVGEFKEWREQLSDLFN